jgi:hypothetical protein
MRHQGGKSTTLFATKKTRALETVNNYKTSSRGMLSILLAPFSHFRNVSYIDSRMNNKMVNQATRPSGRTDLESNCDVSQSARGSEQRE